jgi:hypothetical protein
LKVCSLPLCYVCGMRVIVSANERHFGVGALLDPP